MNRKKIWILAGVLLLIIGVYVIKNKSDQKTENVASETQPVASEQEKKTEQSTPPVDTAAEDKKDPTGPEDPKTQEAETATEPITDEAVREQDMAVMDFDTLDYERLQSYGLPIVIQFGTKDCVYCRMMDETMKKLNETYRDQVIIKYVDIEEFSKFAMQYPIQGTPALMYVKADGSPYLPSAEFETLMYKYNNKQTGEHALTMSFGYLEKEHLTKIIEELLS